MRMENCGWQNPYERKLTAIPMAAISAVKPGCFVWKLEQCNVNCNKFRLFVIWNTKEKMFLIVFIYVCLKFLQSLRLPSRFQRSLCRGWNGRGRLPSFYRFTGVARRAAIAWLENWNESSTFALEFCGGLICVHGYILAWDFLLRSTGCPDWSVPPCPFFMNKTPRFKRVA